ncbi:hypothetical protein RRG08_010170 [Elysia crispata]|uniref:Uncharacterized protein n=1 Tax=Elysia crispata TaxID=231223 RepID=A0AAE1AKR6_9GAST|nr:hypothetical protein RRG08_010170 [Elysia crispata]
MPGDRSKPNWIREPCEARLGFGLGSIQVTPRRVNSVEIRESSCDPQLTGSGHASGTVAITATKTANHANQDKHRQDKGIHLADFLLLKLTI